MMKEIIERAERMGYKSTFYHDISSDPSKKIYSSFFFTELNLNQNQVDYIELCLIQKWLREEKNIIIEITFDYYINEDGIDESKYSISCWDLNKNVWIDLGNYKTYDQTIEEGIKTILEKL